MTHVDRWIAPLRVGTDTGKKQARIASFTDTLPSTGSCHNLLPSTHAPTDQRGHARAARPAGGRTRSRASNFCPVSTARWVGSRKVDWCWSFSSKDVIETSLTTTIFPRTSVLIYLLSPSHLSSFTDAGMDKETSSPTTLLMEKREG